MKNLILFLTLSLVCQFLSAQTGIPDTLYAKTDSGFVAIPTTDVQYTVNFVDDFIQKHKGDWPTSVLGIIMLVVTTFSSAAGIRFLTSLKGLYLFLRIFLKKTINVAIFIGLVLSILATFVVGKGHFTGVVFAVLWPASTMLAVGFHEWFYKKKNPTTATSHAR